MQDVLRDLAPFAQFKTNNVKNVHEGVLLLVIVTSLYVK